MKKEKDFLAVVSTQNGVVIKKHYCKSIGEAVSWAKNNNDRDYFELYVFKGYREIQVARYGILSLFTAQNPVPGRYR